MKTQDALELIELPFVELVFRAQTVHRMHFRATEVQISTLLSVKTGGCPEDCAYCPQSRRYKTGVEDQPLLGVAEVVSAAKAAQAQGATRFCIGAAWRGPKERDLEAILDLVHAVKGLGLETCATLGLLRPGQAERLRDAGLDYYNHNLDTSPQFYGEIITTRQFSDRLQTLEYVRRANLRVCCGGIVGMGESRSDRAALIATLASLAPYPESVPINDLVQVPGTPLYGGEPLDPLEFVRTIAAARISMPTAWIRLSAGRERMPQTVQALCFLAGANSVFLGEKLLTTGNPSVASDKTMFERLGMSAVKLEARDP